MDNFQIVDFTSLNKLEKLEFRHDYKFRIPGFCIYESPVHQTVVSTGSGTTIQNLIKEAVEIRKKAFCPYSNFAVGAVILTEEDSKVYAGCNIESATYTPSICAERSALCRAVCEGYTKFKTIAIVAHQQNFTAPCGVCRQLLSEFRGSDGDIVIYLSKPTMDRVLCTSLSQLLPLSYVSYTEDNILT